MVKGVTQETTKYSYLVGALPKAVAHQVYIALVTKDDNPPYTTLKKQLIEAYMPTPYQRVEQLLDLMAKHTERLSALMDCMLSLEVLGWVYVLQEAKSEGKCQRQAKLAHPPLPISHPAGLICSIAAPRRSVKDPR